MAVFSPVLSNLEQQFTGLQKAQNSLALQLLKNLPAKWQLGQILQAKILSADTQNLKINIKGQVYEAKTPNNFQFRTGETLTLKVDNNQNIPTLKVLERDGKPPTVFLRDQILRHSLPKTGDLKPLLQQITNIKQNLAQFNEKPSEFLRQPLSDLNKLGTTKENISQSNGINKAIQDSGLFLEKKIADVVKQFPQQQNNIHLLKPLLNAIQQNDQKSVLSNLVNQLNSFNKIEPIVLEQTPSQQTKLATSEQQIQNQNQTKSSIQTELQLLTELKQMTKNMQTALASIETNQARAIVTDDKPQVNWVMDLPIKDKQDLDLLHLEIKEREALDKENRKKTSWSVMIKLELEKAGEIHARLVYEDKNISASLWADNPQTYRFMNHYLEILRNNLVDHEINIEQLQTFNRKPKEETEMIHDDSLISIIV